MTEARTQRAIYTALHYALLPLLLARLAWRAARNPGYRHRWTERFGLWPRPRERRGTLWIHAVSVGEVQAAVPLVRALRAARPDAPVLLSTTTPTGAERVAQAFGDTVEHRYFPFDLPGAIERFLDRARPEVAVIMETELWPNLIAACGRRAIPVVLANVRLSARAAAGYGRFRRITADMLGGVAAIAAQTAEDAARLLELGAPRERVSVTGSLKFDVRLPASLREEAQALRRTWGVDRGVWVAASTHDGEEEMVLDAYAALERDAPGTLLVLVPRHPERFAGAAALCRRRGLAAVRRSAAPGSCAGAQVYVGDTMGELPLFYAASDVAFVGGTLVPVGGHNMLEPAALGIPVVVGPHSFNFEEIARRLLEAGAARRVDDAAGLARAVADYLRDADLRHNSGERGRAFVEGNRGALESVMAIVDGALAGAAPAHDGA